MESSQNIIQFTDTARDRFRGPPHGHGFASAPSLYRALQRLRLDIQRMKAQAPGPVAEAVQTAALREDANNTRTTQAVIHDEADEYGGFQQGMCRWTASRVKRGMPSALSSE